jgi:hypothetical protein
VTYRESACERERAVVNFATRPTHAVLLSQEMLKRYDGLFDSSASVSIVCVCVRACVCVRVRVRVCVCVCVCV